MVVKPTNLARGMGATADIRSPHALVKAWRHARAANSGGLTRWPLLRGPCVRLLGQERRGRGPRGGLPRRDPSGELDGMAESLAPSPC